MSAILKAIPALLVASAGALLAWLWLVALVPWIVPLAVAAVAAGVGFALRRIGRSRARSQPVESVRLLEGWALFVLAVGAVAAGVLIVLAVWLANQTPTGTPEATKQVISAFVAGGTAFLTASFIKGLDDFGDLISTSVESDMKSAFASCTYALETPPWLALNAKFAPGATGWGYAERRARAAILAANPCP